MTPMLALRNPADLIAAVPYLLGFHPTDSVVVLGLRAGRVIFQARADLVPAAAELAEQLTGLLARQGFGTALVVGYGTAEQVDPVVVPLRERLAAAGIGTPEALRVAAGRYWSYTCTVATCCPPDGNPYSPDTGTVAAEATLAGMVALPSRSALRARLAPVTGAARESMRRATEFAELRARELVEAALADARTAVGLLTERTPGPTGVRSGESRHLTVVDGGSDPAAPFESLATPGAGRDWLALDRGSQPTGLHGGPDQAPGRARDQVDTHLVRTPRQAALDGASDGALSADEALPAEGQELAAGGDRDHSIGPVLVDGELDRVGRAAIRAARWRFELAGRSAVDHAVKLHRAGQTLDDTDAAWLSVLLVHLPVRDYAWERIADDFGPHLTLWSDLTRRAEARLRAGPATLLAFTAWRAGEGATSTIALELALEADPRYPMAALLARAITAGVDPALWPARERSRPLRRTVRRPLP